MPDFILSKHAMERALDMCLDGEEIRDTFYRPRSVLPAPHGREYWSRGRLTLIVAFDGPVPTVVTVLWARASDWAADNDSVAPSRRGGDKDMTGFRYARKQMRQHKPHRR